MSKRNTFSFCQMLFRNTYPDKSGFNGMIQSINQKLHLQFDRASVELNDVLMHYSQLHIVLVDNFFSSDSPIKATNLYWHPNTSFFKSSDIWWRLHLLRSAIATAFFASSCPTMNLSSEATTSRGLRAVMRTFSLLEASLVCEHRNQRKTSNFIDSHSSKVTAQEYQNGDKIVDIASLPSNRM